MSKNNLPYAAIISRGLYISTSILKVRQGGIPLGKEKEFFDQDACRKQKIRENARVTTVKTKEEQSGGTVD